MTHVGALVLRNLSRFFPFGQDALIWIPWLSSNSTKPRSDDNYQKRSDRKPCIQKAIEAEQIAPLLDLWFLAHVFCLQEWKWNRENNTGYGRQMRKTHEYLNIKKLIDSIIITVDYRLWDVSLVAMIEMIEVFWEAKLHLTLQGLEPVARRDSLWGIRWASWCFVRTASLVSQWCALTLASSCPLDSRSSFANALATWL